MRPLKLRTRLTILILTIAIPIFSAVIVFVSARAGTLLERNALEELHGTNQSLGSSVSRWLDSYTVLLRQLAALPDIISMEPERQKPILLVTASADPKLFLVQTVGLNGINVARNDDSALRDYSDRKWYLGARAGNPITTEALISRTTGNPALNLSMPIRDANGTIVGVISIVSELDDVADSVHASKVGETGYAYVVDELGRVIAHPDPTFSDGLYDLSSSPPVMFLQAGSQGAMNFTDEKGVRWVANVSRLDNGWGIVVQQQEAELLGALRYFQFTSWAFSLAGILLLLVFAAWAIRRALNPIEALTNTALAIAGGDLERVVQVENRDEVGTLAVAFNDMTARMRDLILSLERRIDQLDQTKVALNTSLLRQTAILDNIPDLAWLKDEKSRFIAVNEPFGQACGFIPAELVGKTDLDIWPEELAQGYRKDDYEVMQSGKSKHVEERLMDSAGQERWIETVKTPIFDSRSELIGTAGIARDITERKRIEAALQKSELRYRAIVESTTDLICRFLPDTTLTFVNEAYCRYFGQSRDRLVGTRFLNLIPETDWAAVQEHIASVIRNREPVTYSHEVITPQGEIRWQQWTDSTILSEAGDVVELQSVGRDITEQKMAERSLQESERRFREVLQGVNLAGVMLDRTGRITFINEYLLRITGWSREDALGKDWFDQFLPPDIREDVRMAFGKMLIDNEVVPHYENEIISRQGGRRLVRWNNTTLFDTNGDIIGSASIGEDITESRFMERSLRLSEEKFSKAFRASPDVIVLTSLADGRILDANDSLSFLSGYSRDEVVGKTTAELQFWASPADRERYITVLQRDGRVRDLEVGFRIKSGEIRQALLSGEIIELADGKYILGVIRDITERKTTEQALRSSEERYRLLFENNPQPMWVYDTTTLAFLAVNEAAINAYGYSRDEFLGMTIKDIRPADDLPRLMDNISHLPGGLDHAGYWRHTKKNEEVIDVEITSHTFLFEGREAELVLATDVTERKRADEALKHSEETAMEFQEKMRTLHEVNFELSGIESLDELYHAAVEAGLKKLGFERFALFLIEEDGKYLVGTYGTDEEGSIRTEHHVREEINDTRNKFILDWLLSRTRSIHLKNVTLHGAGRDLDRRGSNVFAIVWDGSQAIGMVVIDNFLTQRPPQPFVEELLSMYGNVIGHLITRLRNEQALRESEQRYRALFEESPISIWEEDFSLVKQRIETLRVQGVKDFQRYFDSHPEEVAECAALVKVVDVNKAALKIYHAEKKEDLLKSLKEILDSSKSLAVFRGELTGIANGETDMYRENIDATLTGELIDVGLSWQVVPGYENSLSKIIVSIIDITTRKQAERDRERLIADLEAKNAELERFTYTVSHDLKSPLVTIKGFLGFLKQDIDSGNMERFNSDLERISNAAQKMEQLLLDLLDLSRIGRLMNPPKDIPFESLVREALELVHGRLEVGGVSVYVQPNLPAIYGDRPRLVEVLQNLIDNAAKYMGDQPKPHIEIGQRGEENGKLVLYVKDNGMGVAPEHHERIFGLFNKLDAQSEGTGVGLALVKRIIEFHGGRIWVEGEAGNGSTFLFTLPPRPSF
jgi:PAS domain S-box-containing protein